jgi:osmoprotectant transport system substrate-binding protein/osmoprotectant transport system permease protein
MNKKNMKNMKNMKNRKNIMKWLSACLSVVTLLTLAGCGASGSQAGGKKDTIVIYDGQFSEMWLVHRAVKLLVEEKTEAKVEIREEMSGVNTYQTILRGDADLMNSYDGTLLTTYLHLDPSDVPADKSLYDFVNEAAKEKKVRLLDKLGLNNTYVLAVTPAVYDKYGMETISDLAPVAGELVFGAEHDFFTEEGSAKFNPLAAFYGLNFKEVKQIDIGLKYSAADSGNIDVTVVYATDGLNRKSQLKTLADDRSFFPEYNGAILVREDLFEEIKETAPDLEKVLNQLGGIFPSEVMTDLTYAVDVEGRDAETVMKEFLQAKGLIAG